MLSCGFVASTSFEPRLGGIDLLLQLIFKDVYDVASFFNQGFRMDPHILQESIVSFGYRLVRFQPMGGALLGNKLESIYHVALTSFMTTLFLHIGRRRFLQYGLIGRHLRDVYNLGLEEEDPDVVLWMLVMGGISVVTERDEDWLFRRIQVTARVAGVGDWKDLHQRLLRFPWVRGLHDVEAERLWYSSLRMGYQIRFDM